jgi:Cu(I)/Ag(I) efflux system periplasmic protein CusF
MNKTALVLVHAAIASLALSGCGRKEASDEGPTATTEQPKPESAGPNDGASMSGDMPMDVQASAKEHSATGMVTAVDAAAGTVTISHGAVESLNWPAMTMAFKLADPNQASTLHANDHVKFKFTVGEKHDATVTMIGPANEGM